MEASTTIAVRAGATTAEGSATARRRLSTPAWMSARYRPTSVRLPQLGLAGIVAVWAAAALPMGLLAWVGAPLLADQLSGESFAPRPDHRADRRAGLAIRAGDDPRRA